MKITSNTILNITVSALVALSASAWAKDDADDKDADKKEETKKEVELTPWANEVTLGLYYLGDDSYRYGKYNGLTDQGGSALADFRFEKRPVWDSGDTVRWRLQGWRLGLDSRRLEFDYNQQGTQKFNLDYREIPNNRFSDGQTPYREESPGLWKVAPDWYVLPGTSNTLGFANLQDSLVNLKVDTKRRRLDLSYERKLSELWTIDVEFRHETKEGARTLGSIFGSAASNPRAVILPAPVDWTTDTVEAMFEYATTQMQLGFGLYASFFSNGEDTFTFQNAYGYRNGWAPGVQYPDAYGRFALEPDNSYVQLKAYGGFNFGASTRLTADVSLGRMTQDENFLPYTINPDLLVEIPLPRTSLDGEVDTAMLNLRLTTQLARRLGLRLNYHYDDRNNKTPRNVYPYISADSQNQRAYEDGRINRPYSYTRQKAEGMLTYRMARSTRLRAGLEYTDYSRDYQEVNDSNELTWLAGITLRGFEHGSLTLDYRDSNRDVSDYTGNAPLINSHLPGEVGEEDWENHPLLRKYYLTDRDRQEARFRADYAPGSLVNLGFAASYAKDDYGSGFFGLNNAKVRSLSIDAGYHPQENIALTAFFTKERYQSYQTANAFFNESSAMDPAYNWSADSKDRVTTWNVALTFRDVGEERGWKGVDFGFDTTFSDTRSAIDVLSAYSDVGALPDLRAKMRTFTLWGDFSVGAQSSLRLLAEKNELTTADWGLDGAVPDSLANVLLLGESAANYDLWLVSASWNYRF